MKYLLFLAIVFAACNKTTGPASLPSKTYLYKSDSIRISQADFHDTAIFNNLWNQLQKYRTVDVTIDTLFQSPITGMQIKVVDPLGSSQIFNSKIVSPFIARFRSSLPQAMNGYTGSNSYDYHLFVIENTKITEIPLNFR